MTFAVQSATSGRQPMWVVEMDLDYCTNTYGAAPCTATGAAGSECYNTRRTCQDTANYDGDPATNTKTYRFCSPLVIASPALGAFPLVESVDVAPTEITRGEGLGPRTNVTIRIRDMAHHDRGIDPYVSTRSSVQGTLWGKLRARNPYYQGRTIHVYEGYASAPLTSASLATEFLCRTYLLETIDGPDANGLVTVTAKDPLKMIDDERAQAPAASGGVLASDITDVAGTFDVDDATGYSASGTVCIGSECMTFTRVGVTFTVVRGTDGTDTATHSADDVVQQCLRYSSAGIDDILIDLLENYAGVPTAMIVDADWAAEVADWLASSTASALITEPTGVRELTAEICEQFLIDLWWDPIASEIKMRVLQPHYTTPDTLSDDSNILADTFRVTDEPDKRLSQVWVYYGIRNQTEQLDEWTNYSYRYIAIDSAAEGTVQYNESRVKKIFSRWIEVEGDATRLANRLVNANRDNPRTFTFNLDGVDYGYGPGDVVTIESNSVVDETGAVDPTDAFIVSARVLEAGHRTEIKAVPEAFSGRYGRIAPNTTPDYDTATELQKQRYAFIAEDTAPQLNGDGPYRIV